ncbi:uncharacterized protein DUF4256 [Pedobacter psychrotolerans]|uniref:Uncharacterized protein DUF4256 n=1 Tax=Pedobacter psychrotolerans TaxID=1843235 RepID=A0A4V2RZ40_9SPHI|nr:DUF4256 domain-containing protein [Pedobacter psychrotolerans]TCO23746.1 uncharacterized protein DUF4256 [Pedobacter psychrotolerans]GGE62289.1 hypothetical protein GCM10011413_30830 [Pedobacter psychrotolerans]
MSTGTKLTPERAVVLINILKNRFTANTKRHADLNWVDIETRLSANPQKLWSLNEMEETGGEPDVVLFDTTSDEYHFMDCSPESPKGRRSLCYDREALDARKENKPQHNVVDLASEMGIELLSEEQYQYLQTLGRFDEKTSSWIKTPEKIRKLGGALFADFRYDTVFVYHNGAQSYYAARAFRGLLKL